jgi:uncharacterized protein
VLIERIGFAPLKGAHHVEHATVDLTAAGPVGDRAFCLVDPERCRVLRTIEHPGLLQSVARWRPPTLSVDLLGVNLEGVPTQTGVRLEVDHWGRAASVEVVDGPWSAAFSAHLGRDVVLGRAIPGAVVYGAAVTLVTSSSARLLAEKLGTRVDSTRFRSTFVINTDELEPHVEDTWTGRPLNLGTAQVQIRGPLEKWSRPVDRRFSCGLLIISLLVLVVGSFDQVAVDEGGAGSDQSDEVGCVDGAPAGLG